VPLDLLDYKSHGERVQTVLKLVGHVDILVNNGGRSQRALAEKTALAVDQDMLALNTIGQIRPVLHSRTHEQEPSP
jgi:NADP-dependent 3-hydroxy acid dehydrogenase YdfG